MAFKTLLSLIEDCLSPPNSNYYYATFLILNKNN